MGLWIGEFPCGGGRFRDLEEWPPARTPGLLGSLGDPRLGRAPHGSGITLPAAGMQAFRFRDRDSGTARLVGIKIVSRILCRFRRGGACRRSRILSRAMRSKPTPKAKPVYSSGSMPHISRTWGCTMPQPKISIQPEPLQNRQPLPPHLKQLTSTSALGSVNGK